MKFKSFAVMGCVVVLMLSATSSAFADGGDWRERWNEDDGPVDVPSGGDPSDFNGYMHWDIELEWDHPDVETEEGNSWCWGMVYTVENEPPPPDAEYDYVANQQQEWDGSGSDLVACPVEDGGVPVETTAMELWVQLGPANLDQIEVPPGYALSGMPAYVLLDGQSERSSTSSDNASGVSISITATPTYTIDFGDGSGEVTTTSQGAPYPATGEDALTHIYSDRGSYTVEVTTQWDAVFNAPGFTDVSLPPRWTVDTYDLDVREYSSARL